MNPFAVLSAAATALLLACPTGPAAENPGEKGSPAAESVSNLGTVAVGRYKAQVLFQYPEDDGKSYRVDVVMSKPADADPIASERIEVWLLARGGKAASPRERPRKGPLVETQTRGASADAMFLFARDVERKDVVAVVVAVDGEFSTLKVSAAGKTR